MPIPPNQIQIGDEVESHRDDSSYGESGKVLDVRTIEQWPYYEYLVAWNHGGEPSWTETVNSVMPVVPDTLDQWTDAPQQVEDLVRHAAWVPVVGDKVLIKPGLTDNWQWQTLPDPKFKEWVENYPEGTIVEISPGGHYPLFRVQGEGTKEGLLLRQDQLTPLRDTAQDEVDMPQVSDTLPSHWGGKYAAAGKGASVDPNKDWSPQLELGEEQRPVPSLISPNSDPLDPELSEADPRQTDPHDYIERQQVEKNAANNIPRYNGKPWWDKSVPVEKQNEAILNAFKVAILSPMKHLKWNAAHYQAIADMPANTPAYKLWDKIDQDRRGHNAALGYNPEGHLSYSGEIDALAQGLEAHQGFTQAEADHEARRQVQEMRSEAETLLLMQAEKHDMELDPLWAEMKVHVIVDHWLKGTLPKHPVQKTKGPRGGEKRRKRNPEEIKNPLQRFVQHPKSFPARPQYQVPTNKPKDIKQVLPQSLFSNVSEEWKEVTSAGPIQQGFDFGDTPPAVQLPDASMYEGENPKGDANPNAKYGMFYSSHLNSIAGLGQHIDELRQAALDDIYKEGGKGFHFRNKVLNLGVSGANPKVASFVWLMLSPMTSDLSILDTHMARVFNVPESEIGKVKNYFKFERKQKAAKDASGYQDMPLGLYHWGLWDLARTPDPVTGLPQHSDHQSLRPLDPLDWRKVKWTESSKGTSDNPFVDPPAFAATRHIQERVGNEFDKQFAGQPLRKAPEIERINEIDAPTYLAKAAEKRKFTMEEARKIGDDIGADWGKYDFRQFMLGLPVEWEHAETVEGNLDTVGKIVLDHLDEYKDYYTRLRAVETHRTAARDAREVARRLGWDELSPRGHHKMWGWTDPNGVQHTVTSGNPDTHSKDEREHDAFMAEKRMRQCQRGTCAHMPIQTGWQIEPVQEQPQQLQVGQTVQFEGQPHIVADVGAGLAVLQNTTTGEEVYINPATMQRESSWKLAAGDPHACQNYEDQDEKDMYAAIHGAQKEGHVVSFFQLIAGKLDQLKQNKMDQLLNRDDIKNKWGPQPVDRRDSDRHLKVGDRVIRVNYRGKPINGLSETYWPEEYKAEADKIKQTVGYGPTASFQSYMLDKITPEDNIHVSDGLKKLLEVDDQQQQLIWTIDDITDEKPPIDQATKDVLDHFAADVGGLVKVHTKLGNTIINTYLNAKELKPIQRAVTEPTGNTHGDHLQHFLEQLPPEAYKLMDWIVRQWKQGNINPYNQNDALDVIQNAATWYAWANKFSIKDVGMPDLNNKATSYQDVDWWVNRMKDYPVDPKTNNIKWPDEENKVAQLSNGYYIAHLDSYDDFNLEGKLMNNCVGSDQNYKDQNENGQWGIFSLRDKTGRPHATMAIGFRNAHEWVPMEVRGQNNSDLERMPEEYAKAVNEWFNDLQESGITIDNSTVNDTYAPGHPEFGTEDQEMNTDDWDHEYEDGEHMSVDTWAEAIDFYNQVLHNPSEFQNDEDWEPDYEREVFTAQRGMQISSSKEDLGHIMEEVVDDTIHQQYIDESQVEDAAKGIYALAHYMAQSPDHMIFGYNGGWKELSAQANEYLLGLINKYKDYAVQEQMNLTPEPEDAPEEATTAGFKVGDWVDILPDPARSADSPYGSMLLNEQVGYITDFGLRMYDQAPYAGITVFNRSNLENPISSRSIPLDQIKKSEYQPTLFNEEEHKDPTALPQILNNFFDILTSYVTNPDIPQMPDGDAGHTDIGKITEGQQSAPLYRHQPGYQVTLHPATPDTPEHYNNPDYHYRQYQQNPHQETEWRAASSE